MRPTNKSAALVADAYILALRCGREKVAADDLIIAAVGAGTEADIVSAYTRARPEIDPSFEIATVNAFLDNPDELIRTLMPYLTEQTKQLINQYG